MPIYHVKEIISTTNRKNNGDQIRSCNGKDMWRTEIALEEYPDIRITGFTPFEPDNRLLGVQDLIITEKAWDGGVSYQFSFPRLMSPEAREKALKATPPLPPKPPASSDEAVLLARVAALESKVRFLSEMISASTVPGVEEI